MDVIISVCVGKSLECLGPVCGFMEFEDSSQVCLTDSPSMFCFIWKITTQNHKVYLKTFTHLDCMVDIITSSRIIIFMIILAIITIVIFLFSIKEMLTSASIIRKNNCTYPSCTCAYAEANGSPFLHEVGTDSSTLPAG